MKLGTDWVWIGVGVGALYLATQFAKPLNTITDTLTIPFKAVNDISTGNPQNIQKDANALINIFTLSNPAFGLPLQMFLH